MNSSPFFSGIEKSWIITPVSLSLLLASIMFLLFNYIVPVFSVFFGAFGAGTIEIVAIAIIALGPLFYGWITKNSAAAVLFGLLLNVLIFIAFNLVSTPPGFVELKRISVIIAYGGGLAICGGFSGYMAAKGAFRHIIVALFSVLLWIGILLQGIK